MEKLFESLDEKIFTNELKAELTEKFNEAVQSKAELKAAEIAAEKIEEKVSELEEKAEEFQKTLEEEAETKQKELLDQVDAYLEKVVDDFVTESREALDESIKDEKADMIIEAMEAMIVSTGVDIAKISEAVKDTEKSSKIDESIEKYDSLVEENIRLEKEVSKLMKMGVIAEMKEGMSVVDAEKFGKLAELVEFDKSEEYIQKLETIKESFVKETPKDEIIEPDQTNHKKLDESAKSDKSAKSAKSVVTSFSHLL